MANNKCKECGCVCKKCGDHDVQLHVEIENLKQKLFERENHIVTMETNFLNEANKFPSGELVALRDELLTWQDKYKRLYDAHRRVQRVNQGLEDKLLKLVDICETDKTTLTKDVATLSHKLAEANYAVKKLTEDNERYKNDLSLAVQFLKCKQSNFVSQKLDSLAPEVQSQVSMMMTSSTSTKRKPEERRTPPEMRSIKVPIPTFPPTAMVYSIPKSPKPERRVEVDEEAPQVDIVSAAIMAKVLEERQKERLAAKHCDTCTCSKNLKIIYDITHHSIGTQTGDYKETTCIRCNDVMNLNNSTSVKLVRNVDLQLSQTKVPTTIEAVETSQQQNVVKVQPNNFLLDNKSKTTSNNSTCPVDLITPISPKNDLSNSNQQLLNGPEVMFYNVNEVKKSPKIENTQYEEKRDTEKVVGPRYCSMRTQVGSSNILLDNTSGNVAPVLYTTRQNGNVASHVRTAQSARKAATAQAREGDVDSLPSDENSAQTRQRVAEWIQSTVDNDLIIQQ
ncbi:unnamed protein product [Brassicogethes aeneus]|uniref:Tight junction-associated protein 1 n=1 Tax=Brassicogethes aeneus TaxID=1431903 RepID=A0A9P0ATN2_BRAAE|nr:unnamed protein product [Brassicogethes aeneus]